MANEVAADFLPFISIFYAVPAPGEGAGDISQNSLTEKFADRTFPSKAALAHLVGMADGMAHLHPDGPERF